MATKPKYWRRAKRSKRSKKQQARTCRRQRTRGFRRAKLLVTDGEIQAQAELIESLGGRRDQ